MHRRCPQLDYASRCAESGEALLTCCQPGAWCFHGLPELQHATRTGSAERV